MKKKTYYMRKKTMRYVLNSIIMIGLAITQSVMLAACDDSSQSNLNVGTVLYTETEFADDQIPQSSYLEKESDSVEEPEASIPRTDQAPSQLSSHYIQDSDIPSDRAVRIIDEIGTFDENNYSVYAKEGGWLLGADSDKNILVLSNNGNDVKRIAKDGNETIVFHNLLTNQNHMLDSIAWDGEDYIAWAECRRPTESEIEDGSDWEINILNIQTGEKLQIAKDNGIRPEIGSAYYYLCPTKIANVDGFVSYVTFAQREDGQIVQAIALYEIALKQHRIIYYLDGDPKENGLGYPSIGSGYVAWAQAYIRPQDGLYEGYTLLYDLSTQKITILESTENIINPCIADGWIVCENHPNETYYDGQIVAYQIERNAWIYKISAEYPDYYSLSTLGVSLCFPSSWGSFITWHGSPLSSVIVMDLQSGTLYKIVENAFSVKEVLLYPGGLLAWFEQYKNDAGETEQCLRYCFLKKEETVRRRYKYEDQNLDLCPGRFAVYRLPGSAGRYGKRPAEEN